MEGFQKIFNMNCFGLITEGATDQEVISTILAGIFDNSDIDPNFIQPSRSTSFQDQTHGGWPHTLAFCASEEFKQTFQTNRFIIIHIDTDICDQPGFEVSKVGESGNITVEELCLKVREKLISFITQDFYTIVQDRIIFAICVENIECWLLPIYYSSQKSKRGKTVGCLDTLNIELKKQLGFYIDEKKLEYYQKASKPYLKGRELRRLYKLNPSLQLFVDDVISREIDINNC